MLSSPSIIPNIKAIPASTNKGKLSIKIGIILNIPAYRWYHIGQCFSNDVIIIKNPSSKVCKIKGNIVGNITNSLDKSNHVELNPKQVILQAIN